jgi:transcriptional regulator with XRE-family HTH domain
MARRGTENDEQRYPPGFAEALGRAIKVLRTDLGVERRDLAERAGISYSYLTEIENGNKPPSSSVLGPIATALGLRMSQLIEAAEARMGVQAQTPAWSTVDRLYAMQPSLRGPDRDLRSAVIEIERLLRTMAPEDIERLLDFASRLTR